MPGISSATKSSSRSLSESSCSLTSLRFFTLLVEAEICSSSVSDMVETDDRFLFLKQRSLLNNEKSGMKQKQQYLPKTKAQYIRTKQYVTVTREGEKGGGHVPGGCLHCLRCFPGSGHIDWRSLLLGRTVDELQSLASILHNDADIN